MLFRSEIILSFLRLHPSTAFWTLLLTMMAIPFLLRAHLPGALVWSQERSEAAGRPPQRGGAEPTSPPHPPSADAPPRLTPTRRQRARLAGPHRAGLGSEQGET